MIIMRLARHLREDTRRQWLSGFPSCARYSEQCGDTLFKPIADLEFCHGRFELVGKGVINAFLHIDAIGADAGLSIIAKFGDQRPFHRRVEIGVVKYDEGCIAAQLQPQLLDAGRTLRHQLRADFG